MRKIMIAAMITITLITTPAFAETPVDGGSTDSEESYITAVEQSLDLLKEAWNEQAEKYPDMMSAPYVDIKNTRIVKIADNPVNVQNDNKPVEELEGVDYLIEFLMYSNYYGDTYPISVGAYDTVAVYQDGSMEVQKSNLMNAIRARYYISDFSGIINEIIDLEGTFNGNLF